MMVRWYVSGWHIRPKGCKKPYNPLLGEEFFAFWDHGDSKSVYVAEQVSHHPPVSAIYIENRKKNIAINAQIWTKSKFLGNSAASIPIGEARFYVTNRDEYYSITFPTIYACGLFIGKLRMELGGKQKIVCEKTGLTAEIEFRTKPMFGGDYNRVRGKIEDSKGNSLYTFEGKWDSDIQLKNTQQNGDKQVMFDAKTCPLQRKYVTKIDKQGPWESRRVWTGLSDALRKNDHDQGTKVKTYLEDKQRERRAIRQEQKIIHATKYFHLEDDRWVYNNIKLDPYDPEHEDGNKLSIPPHVKNVPAPNPDSDQVYNGPDIFEQQQNARPADDDK
jgi:oxysterol-binding protein-related protein 8